MLHYSDEYVQLKGKQSIGLVWTVLKLKMPSYMPYSNIAPNSQHPKTPPTLTTPPHLPGRPSSCRDKEEAKKETEARRKDRGIYVFLYIPGPQTSQHGVATDAGCLCACLRKKVRLRLKAYKKSRYSGTTRVRYEQRG